MNQWEDYDAVKLLERMPTDIEQKIIETHIVVQRDVHVLVNSVWWRYSRSRCSPDLVVCRLRKDEEL
jgi:hypothetical protein